MCGIFAFLAAAGEPLTDAHLKFLEAQSALIAHRGPDSTTAALPADHLYFSFHRLAINGLDTASGQPMCLEAYPHLTLMCNGEIYNHEELAAEHGIKLVTGSDCEIILHLFALWEGDVGRVALALDGVFGFVICDAAGESPVVYAARDHLGVRPLYIGSSGATSPAGAGTVFASEAKAAALWTDTLQQFPPRTWWVSTAPADFTPYYALEFKMLEPAPSAAEAAAQIKALFTAAVAKRQMADREIGCLLSGGLDSSLVAALCAECVEDPSMLKTFSIGLPGSPDLVAAQAVADHLGTTHYVVDVDEATMIDAIRDTIYTLGSFDVTTVRASVGHRLVSLYVAEHTDVKVLFSGEVADEASGSYAYFGQAPSPEAFQEEALRLLEDIHFFDGLRSCRSISAAGLESRVPFSDKAFLAYYMSLPPACKMFGAELPAGASAAGAEVGMEKALLRAAFAGDDLLPESVLWRRKNGFSDSVSDINRSWSVIIGEHVDGLVSDAAYEEGRLRYAHDTPMTKEGYYYRTVFEELYGDRHAANLTPYQWLPRWCGDVVDPSARVLATYAAD